MSTQRDVLIEQAKATLRGEANIGAAELVERAKTAESNRLLRYARLMLLRAQQTPDLDPALRHTIGHRLARCTYKDPDLPIYDRLDEAERILETTDDLSSTTNQETLGLAGAIQKRKWEAYGQKQYLERALAYYRRGYEQGPAQDDGYTGINAAFVLDQLAHEEESEARRAGAVSSSADDRRAEAARIREHIVQALPQRPEQHDNWWSLVTVAEALFGLRRYDEAGAWLRQAQTLARKSGVPDWQRESTARQLANLQRLQSGTTATPARRGFDSAAERSRPEAARPELRAPAEFAASPAGQVLREFLGDSLPGVLGLYRGKVGVALSGGGFRAALFHIGVLARLAELDVLRHVEVLSCVSGGSIIGTHYYLELRELLENKPDHLIDRQDYIDLVQRVERDFLAGVQANIRMRVIADLVHNLRMLFTSSYSRTHRVGELYEELIYSRIGDGNGKTKRWLNGLFVRPHGESGDFHPSFDNWRRNTKVPQLVLNATSLNTGHAWQFTASWMGEPPTNIDSDVDSNDRYRRMYYHEAPKDYRSFRLGYAVAASSCVPGLFEPLPLAGLYPDRVVQLVDGGVHDNQGIVSLLEQNCDVILVSDASGQMSSQSAPSDGVLNVPMRTNDILMARVRESQYRELAARRRSSMLRGLMFLHLKKELDVHSIDWLECDEPQPPQPPHSLKEPTSYGVRRDVQGKLAAIRTDLDSFSDLEAYALMASGYRMARTEFDHCLPHFAAAAAQNEPAQWHFLAVDPLMNGTEREGKSARLERVLDVARSRTLKIWKLSRALNVLGIALVLAAAAAALYFLWTNRSEVAFQFTWGAVLGAIAPIAIAFFLGRAVAQAVNARSTASRFAVKAGVALIGWLIALIHLLVFDRLYLRYGRVRPTVAGEPAPAAAPAPAMPPVARRPVVPEPVLLGASSPRAVRPGDEFTARFVAYIKSLETEIRRTLEGLSPGSAAHLGVHTCRWAPGTRVSVRLSAAHVTVDPPEETFEWSGERNLVEFDARVDQNAPEGKTILKFDVSIDGIRVARLRVDLVIAPTADPATGAVIGEPARTAFASYSSEDRARVLDRIASVRTRANIDVFLDCLSIHPGEQWKARLVSEIEQRDIFLLFWSTNARKSEWVEWEWKTALDSRGIDNIEPHPLDPVAAAPPPPELADLHFGDPLVLIREQTLTAENAEGAKNGQ